MKFLVKGLVKASFFIIINFLVVLAAFDTLEDKEYFFSTFLILSIILADVGVFYLTSLETD